MSDVRDQMLNLRVSASEKIGLQAQADYAALPVSDFVRGRMTGELSPPPRSEGLKVRVTADEKRLVEARAKRAGLEVSDFLRRQLGGAELSQARGRQLVADPKLVAQIARIGSNLNQIAAWLNRVGMQPSDQIQLLAVLVSIEQQLSHALDQHKGKRP